MDSLAPLERADPRGDRGSCATHAPGRTVSLQGRGSRPPGEHGVDDALGIPSVLLAVGVVDPALEVGVGLDEGHVLLDAAGLDPTLVASLGAPEPVGGAPVHGPDEEVVAQPDLPNR